MSAVAGTAHQAFVIASTVIWGFYRSFYFDRAAKVSCTPRSIAGANVDCASDKLHDRKCWHHQPS